MSGRSTPGRDGRTDRARGRWCAAFAMKRLAAEPSHAVSSCAATPMTMTSHRPWSVSWWRIFRRGDTVRQALGDLDAQERTDLDDDQEPESRHATNGAA